MYFCYMCYFVNKMLLSFNKLLIAFFLFCGRIITDTCVRGLIMKLDFTKSEENNFEESIDFYANI